MTSRQYFPKDRQNAGFDWFSVHADKISGNLVVVVTEAKYSSNLESSSNKIDPNEDIVKKFNNTIKSFEAAGWKKEQVFFRLAAHRYLPLFKSKTMDRFEPNVVVCGSTKLSGTYSRSLQDVFSAMASIDNLK